MGSLVFASYSVFRNVFHFRSPTYDFIYPRFPAVLPATFQICWFLSNSSFCRNFQQASHLGIAWGVDQVPPLAPRLRKSRAVPVLLYPLWALMACSGLNFWIYIGVLHLFSLKTSSFYLDSRVASHQCRTFACAYHLHFVEISGRPYSSVWHLIIFTNGFVMPAFAAGLHVPTLPMARKISFFPFSPLCSRLCVVWLTAQCTFSWWPTMRIIRNLYGLFRQYWYILGDTNTLYSGADFILHQIIHISDLSCPQQNYLLLLPEAVRSVPDSRNSNI